MLVTDFWRVYDSVAKHQQKCWPHLLRDLKEVDAEAPDEEWKGFSKKLKRICADGIRLKLARDDLGEAAFDSRVAAPNGRRLELGIAEWAHPDARRLAKRLVTDWDSLLRFVEHRSVPADNNRADREIRRAVMMRKASYGSGSDRGADTRSVLMSIYRTLKRRGVNALSATGAALRTYIADGTLPPLPTGPTAEN